MYFLLYQSTATLEMYLPPWLNDTARFWSFADTGSVGIGRRIVFGFSKPPDQYQFTFVPRNTEVLSLVDPTLIPSDNTFESAESPATPKLSSSFNLVKGIAAMLQLLYTSFTLYHTNGGQLKQYGFAAPGLTVLPYAVMSGLNLLANLVTPSYPTLYLVRSKVMEEAERRTGSRFHYVVGKVVEEPGTDDDGWSEIAGSFQDDGKVLYVAPSAGEDKDKRIEISDDSSQKLYVPACPRFRRTDDPRCLSRRSIIPSKTYEICLVTFIVAAEICIALALSKFSAQQSTFVQRTWMVTWLFAGYLYGVMSYLWGFILFQKRGRLSPLMRGVLLVYMFIFVAPPIGGFLVASQMLQAYGICYKFA